MMNNNDILLKKGIYISVIVFSILLFSMFILLPYIMLEGAYSIWFFILIMSSLLLTVSSLLLFALSIIMIVKICSDKDISTTDKIIWSLLSYFFNSFALAFAYEKFVSKTNNYKSAIRLAVFHGMCIVLSIIFYIIFFISLASALNI